MAHPAAPVKFVSHRVCPVMAGVRAVCRQGTYPEAQLDSRMSDACCGVQVVDGDSGDGVYSLDD